MKFTGTTSASAAIARKSLTLKAGSIFLLGPAAREGRPMRGPAHNRVEF
jgi:hypothetical protein